MRIWFKRLNQQLSPSKIYVGWWQNQTGPGQGVQDPVEGYPTPACYEVWEEFEARILLISGCESKRVWCGVCGSTLLAPN